MSTLSIVAPPPRLMSERPAAERPPATHCPGLGCGAPLAPDGTCTARCFPVHPDAMGKPKHTCKFCKIPLSKSRDAEGLPQLIEPKTGFKHSCPSISSEAAKRCDSCGALIRWRTNESGKRQPFNLDGVAHHATCSDAEKWHRRPEKLKPPKSTPSRPAPVTVPHSEVKAIA